MQTNPEGPRPDQPPLDADALNAAISASRAAAGRPELARPAPQVKMVTKRRIACDGDQEHGLGHPRVWLTIPESVGFVDCGYCDCRYVLDPKADLHGDH